MNETKITPRQLREILFYLQNQEMTVRELRQELFEVVEQDEPMEVGHAMFVKMGVERK